MSAQHTPGRLVVRPHGGNWSASYEGYGATVYMGIVSDTGEVVALATAYSPNPFREPEGPDENARRLVACWNACDGITDPENVVPRLLALNELVPNLEHQAATLRVQRDELLAALSRIAKWNEHTTEFAVDFGSNGVRDFYRGIASRAIAKVEGGAL